MASLCTSKICFPKIRSTLQTLAVLPTRTPLCLVISPHTLGFCFTSCAPGSPPDCSSYLGQSISSFYWFWLLSSSLTDKRIFEFGFYSYYFGSFFFLGELGLNSGLNACKTDALLLEPHLQAILLWLFGRWGLTNYLPMLTSNFDPPNLSFPNS
jgi:hypothetical protein